MIIQNIRQMVEMMTRDPNPDIKRAAVCAMLWGGNARNIEMVRPHLQSPDIHLRRGAAATLANLTFTYQPRKLSRLQRQLLKFPVEVRKTAAYGFNEIVRSGIKLDLVERSNVDFEKGY